MITFTLGWFIANAMSGLGANPSVLASASIAWEAHIGGFLLGFLAFPLFDRHEDAAEPAERIFAAARQGSRRNRSLSRLRCRRAMSWTNRPTTRCARIAKCGTMAHIA